MFLSDYWFRARYLIAVLICVLVTILTLPLRGWLELANIVMLFLLVVFIAAVKLGRGPAVLAAFLSVALFDLFFVPPHLSFTVVDAQYLVTFVVMLAVGLITSHLAAQISEQNDAILSKERETSMLYELARHLGAALSLDEAITIVARFLQTIDMNSALLIDTGSDGKEACVLLGPMNIADQEKQLALDAYRQNANSRAGNMVFLPFAGATRVRGVLVVANASERMQPLLTAVASLAGIAIERLHYAEIAQHSELEAQSEKLRSSILSSLSHDLRTPLTSLVGLADSLAGTLTGQSAETAGIVRDQALAMHRMVTNLLEMARLHSGRVMLNKQWQPLDDIVGSSVRLLNDILAGRKLVISLPADLPLVCFDAVLMERVLCNLLENAAKYSTPATPIELTARTNGSELEVVVSNLGSGFPSGNLDQVFDPFVRGQQEPAIPGTGIGLAVCREIVVAHGGRITAENREGSACVRFTLPLGSPPALEVELS
jgi:two-component system sensor histidine kinase KdpD